MAAEIFSCVWRPTRRDATVDGCDCRNDEITNHERVITTAHCLSCTTGALVSVCHCVTPVVLFITSDQTLCVTRWLFPGTKAVIWRSHCDLHPSQSARCACKIKLATRNDVCTKHLISAFHHGLSVVADGNSAMRTRCLSWESSLHASMAATGKPAKRK